MSQVIVQINNFRRQGDIQNFTLEKKLIPFHTNLEGHSPQREGNQPLKHKEWHHMTKCLLQIRHIHCYLAPNIVIQVRVYRILYVLRHSWFYLKMMSKTRTVTDTTDTSEEHATNNSLEWTWQKESAAFHYKRTASFITPPESDPHINRQGTL